MKIRLGFIILFCISAISLTAETASSDSIVRVGACATPGLTWGVYVQDGFAYVATRGGLAIVDVATPSNPNTISYIDNVFISALGVAVTDTVAVLNAELIGMLTNINIAAPGSPSLLGWCFTNSCVGIEPKGISVLNNVAYQAIGNLGFWIVDISVPDTPAVIDSFDTPGVVIDLFVKDSLAYIVDYDSLQIVNVVTSPFRIGAVAMPNACYDVFVVDTFAYVVCQSNFGNDGSLQVVNVSNPAVPQIVASINTLNGDASDIWILGDYAYVAAADYWSAEKGKERQVGGIRSVSTLNKRADVEGGLRVVDISDPLTPILVASYDTPGDPRGVFTVDTLVFIADYDSLQILKHVITGIKEISGKNSERDLRLQILPNPFSNTTKIHYHLPTSNYISLKIFDITGRIVKTIYEGNQDTGNYTINWNGKDENDREVASGIYLCCLASQSGSLFKKIIVTK